MKGDRRACRPSSRSVTRMAVAGTEGTLAIGGVGGDSSSGASTLDAVHQTWSGTGVKKKQVPVGIS